MHFLTGLVSSKAFKRTPGPWKGRGWLAKLARTDRIRRADGLSSGSREIVITAKHSMAAQKARDLIWMFTDILYSVSLAISELPKLKQDNGRFPDDGDGFELSRISCFGLDDACRLAAIASRSHKLTYAAALLFLSRQLHANDAMDIDPKVYPYQQRSGLPYDHVRFAYAIVSAYAVVEHLELEIKANNKNPATINGAWNPIVLAELESRHHLQGISTKNTVVFCLRGSRTRIEKKFAPKQRARATWSRFRIRDASVTVADAILYARNLRNQAAAHSIKPITSVLSVEDVFNVQNLAKYLILKCLGYKK